MTSLEIASVAFGGGIVPALFWLWFWLREDGLHPEPRGLIALSFVGGMFAVIIVSLIGNSLQVYYAIPFAILVSFFSPIIEEVTKYICAHFLSLERAEDDEPIDPVIYMITVALGFAALENTFFLLHVFNLGGDVIKALSTNLGRFLGSTLLHVISSATVGLFLGFSFYDRLWLKRIAMILGLIVASILHILFNYFILNGTETHRSITFIFVWVTVVILLLAFERVKRVHPAFRRK